MPPHARACGACQHFFFFGTAISLSADDSPQTLFPPPCCETWFVYLVLCAALKQYDFLIEGWQRQWHWQNRGRATWMAARWATHKSNQKRLVTGKTNSAATFFAACMWFWQIVTESMWIAAVWRCCDLRLMSNTSKQGEILVLPRKNTVGKGKWFHSLKKKKRNLHVFKTTFTYVARHCTVFTSILSGNWGLDMWPWPHTTYKLCCFRKLCEHDACPQAQSMFLLYNFASQPWLVKE